MKKIIIISIIACCLLSFMEISCLAEKPMSPGEYWTGLTKLDRNGVKISELVKKNYIRGIGKGILSTVTIIDLNELDFDKICDHANFVLQYNEEIMKIMDDLYKDPANVNIKLDWMCLIAYSKLKGEDVELLIKDGRTLGLLPDL